MLYLAEACRVIQIASSNHKLQSPYDGMIIRTARLRMTTHKHLGLAMRIICEQGFHIVKEAAGVAQASTNLDTLLGQHHPSLLPDDLANTAGSDTDTAPDLPPWSAAAIWLRYVARLTQIVAQHLPDLWLMSSEQLTTLATVSDRAKQLVDGSVTLVATSLRNILERYRSVTPEHMCLHALVHPDEHLC